MESSAITFWSSVVAPAKGGGGSFHTESHGVNIFFCAAVDFWFPLGFLSLHSDTRQTHTRAHSTGYERPPAVGSNPNYYWLCFEASLLLGTAHSQPPGQQGGRGRTIKPSVRYRGEQTANCDEPTRKDTANCWANHRLPGSLRCPLVVRSVL